MYEEEDSSPREGTYRQRSEEVIEIYSANNSDQEGDKNIRDELAQTIEKSEHGQGSLLAGSEEIKATRSLHSTNTKSFNTSPDLDRALELVPNNPNLQESENEREKAKNTSKKRKMKSWEFGDRYTKRVKPGPDFSPSISSTHFLRSIKSLTGGPKPLNRLKKNDVEGQVFKNVKSDASTSTLHSSESRFKVRDKNSKKRRHEANDSYRNRVDLERSSKRCTLEYCNGLESSTPGPTQNKNLNHPVPELWKVDELMRIKRKPRFKNDRSSSDFRIPTFSKTKWIKSDSANKQKCIPQIVINDDNDTDTLEDECKEVELDSTTLSNFKKREQPVNKDEELEPNPTSPKSSLFASYLKNTSRHFISPSHLLPRDIAKISNNQASLGSVDNAHKKSSYLAKELSESHKLKASNENFAKQSNPDLSLDEISIAHYDDASKRTKIKNSSRNVANFKKRTISNNGFEKSADVGLSSEYFNQVEKNDSLVKENPQKKIYSILQVFCKSKLWLEPPENQMEFHEKWTVHFDLREKSLKVFDENNDVVPDLSLGRINSIQASRTQGKMIIYKPISAQELVGTHQVCLELSHPRESHNFLRRLRKYDPNIEIVYKEQDLFFEKVFENTLRIVRSIVKRSMTEKNESQSSPNIHEAKDLSATKIRSAQKNYNTTTETSSQQHSPLEQRSIVKSMTTRSQPTPIDERLMSASKTLTSTLLEIPDEVCDENKCSSSHEAPRTRSGKTNLRNTNAPRLPSPEIEFKKWTRSNPNWKKKWHCSIVYPPVGKNKATVDCADIERLDEGEFLNDNLMMFYLRWLQQRSEQESPEIANRVYFHNTFFYERLTNSEKGKSGINYENVKRWTSKVNLFQYDYIVVPINENYHWYVALICNAPKLLGKKNDLIPKPELSEGTQSTGINAQRSVDCEKISCLSPLERSPRHSPGLEVDTVMNRMTLNNNIEESVDSETDPVLLSNSDVEFVPVIFSKKRKQRKENPSPNSVSEQESPEPRIITLDSFGRSHSLTCTNLKKYLLREAESKLNVTIDDPGNLGKTAKNIPQQDNFFDCGLFVLGYIEIFLRNPDNFVSDLLQNKFPDDIRWQKPSEIRANIRTLLFKLQSESLK